MLIKPYTSDWIKHFEALKKALDQALHGLNYNIEHIGSTSVPDLDSKPIIDIDIIFKNDSDFKSIKSRLILIGYYHNGNQGIEKREVFKRNKISTNSTLDTITHHLYACPLDSKPLERHILFRDYLRTNDDVRLAYQEMKYELAEKAKQNKKLYAELKELHINSFVDKITELQKQAQQ